MGALDGKVAIVTGASSGIGYAAARLFAAEGARIVVAARGRAGLEALVAEVSAEGGEAAMLAGDVREETHARALVELARRRFGGLDVALNNAGSVGEVASAPELSAAAWRECIDTNLTGAFFGARYQVPAMRERGGSIIFTSSFVGHTVGMPGMAAYAAAKAGLQGLMQVLAVEGGPHGIRVNTLVPGGTDTPANVANAPGAPAEVRSFVEGLHVLKRMAHPEEIARAALFLASDASSFTTGAMLHADGGVSINRN